MKYLDLANISVFHVRESTWRELYIFFYYILLLITITWRINFLLQNCYTVVFIYPSSLTIQFIMNILSNIIPPTLDFNSIYVDQYFLSDSIKTNKTICYTILTHRSFLTPDYNENCNRIIPSFTSKIINIYIQTFLKSEYLNG